MTASSQSPAGVSIVICCHNGAARLEPTLAHLSAQRVPASIPWEVILVDNGSTDGTVAVAWRCAAQLPVPFRVVTEPALGISHARVAGFDAARYDYVSFVDDDNWVSSNWVETVYNDMLNNPQAGACGGTAEAVFESEPPAWFERFQVNYAVGQQASAPGYLTGERYYLFGAGLTIRKTAWLHLLNSGFKMRLTGRKGRALSSGEDTELCLALQILGWQLYADPALRLKHYMPSGRLEWSYLRRLRRAIGTASVLIDTYRFVLAGKGLDTYRGRFLRIPWLSKIWKQSKYFLTKWQFILAAQKLHEGDERILDYESRLGRQIESLRLGPRFETQFREIQEFAARNRKID